jgi:hypothetical protein
MRWTRLIGIVFFLLSFTITAAAQQVLIQPTEKRIDVPPLQFEAGGALSAGSVSPLEELAGILHSQPGIESLLIKASTHQQAQTVKQFLMNYGISRERLSTASQGPVTVEFILKKFDESALTPIGMKQKAPPPPEEIEDPLISEPSKKKKEKEKKKKKGKQKQLEPEISPSPCSPCPPCPSAQPSRVREAKPKDIAHQPYSDAEMQKHRLELQEEARKKKYEP